MQIIETNCELCDKRIKLINNEMIQLLLLKEESYCCPDCAKTLDKKNIRMMKALVRLSKEEEMGTICDFGIGLTKRLK